MHTKIIIYCIIIALTATSVAHATTQSTYETTQKEQILRFVPFTSYLYKGTRMPIRLSPELQEYTYRMCQKYDVPYRIIMGLMGVESGWNADIGEKTNGSATYVGLGMLRDIYNADHFAQQGIDIYTPEGNIEAICIIIQKNLKNFDGNITYALMAYNLGTGGARAKIRNGIHETEYTKRIIAYAKSFV